MNKLWLVLIPVSLLSILFVYLLFYPFEHAISSGGRSFTVENPQTKTLTIDAHSQSYQDFKLQLFISSSERAECGCVLHDCYYMTRCGSPDSDCQSAGYAQYMPECSPCSNCGSIVKPTKQACVGCGRYVYDYPNIVTIETDNSIIATWHKGDSSTLITNNFASDVNYLCPPSSSSCTMTITATASENKGRTGTWSVYSESLLPVTTTSTSTTTSTVIPTTTTSTSTSTSTTTTILGQTTTTTPICGSEGDECCYSNVEGDPLKQSCGGDLTCGSHATAKNCCSAGLKCCNYECVAPTTTTTSVTETTQRVTTQPSTTPTTLPYTTTISPKVCPGGRINPDGTCSPIVEVNIFQKIVNAVFDFFYWFSKLLGGG